MPTLTPAQLEFAKTAFLKTDVPRVALAITAVLGILHYLCIAFVFPSAHPILFAFLIFGQTFLLWQALTFLWTVWNTKDPVAPTDAFIAPVDVFITVAGEPVEIIEQTVRGALAMDYPDVRVHILNDGYVAKKDNWQEVEELAKRLGANCITRREPGGAKAGNINNALRQTENPFVVIFDADHVPARDFLARTMPYMADERMGFVQTPQFYKNFRQNFVTKCAWEQQELFFGPICKGKNRLNSATMCGTNMVIRREAIMEVGGMNEASIAEDFITGVFMHARGWKSVYVPKVLAEGLAPEDFLSYYKQQFRWARGALDVIFRFNVLTMRGLTLSQRLQYLSSASFFLSGTIVFINILIPLAFFYLGIVPVAISGMLLALILLPYLFLTFYTLQRSTNSRFTFESLAFATAGFNIHLQALWAAMTGRKSTFSITSKTALQGNFVKYVIPHLAYILLVIVGVGVAIAREGVTASLINNLAWALVFIGVFSPFIYAALPQGQGASSPIRLPRRRKALVRA